MSPQKQDNPNAFKHLIGPELLNKLASAISSVNPSFNGRELEALGKELGPLELKARVRLIRDCLRKLLPLTFPEAATLLCNAAQQDELNGFDLWPITEYVQTYGLEHPEQSMKALHFLTRKFTAEFAVRPFLTNNFDRTLKLLTKWSRDADPHVRRLASEGTRLRLPWGQNVEGLASPTLPTLPILENLKFDSELYVRKSVANHLNDLTRPHPEAVIKILARWNRECPSGHREKIEWITRQALRTLVKKGHPGALKLMGCAHDVKVKASKMKLSADSYQLNDVLEFDFELQSEAEKPQKLIIDYVIHHVTARGKERSRKVFKLKTIVLGAHEKVFVSKRHALRPITTRNYYAGQHLLEIQVNGKIVLKRIWTLKLKQGSALTRTKAV